MNIDDILVHECDACGDRFATRAALHGHNSGCPERDDIADNPAAGGKYDVLIEHLRHLAADNDPWTGTSRELARCLPLNAAKIGQRMRHLSDDNNTELEIHRAGEGALIRWEVRRDE